MIAQRHTVRKRNPGLRYAGRRRRKSLPRQLGLGNEHHTFSEEQEAAQARDGRSLCWPAAPRVSGVMMTWQSPAMRMQSAVGLPASRYLHHACLHANPPRKHAADPTRPRGGAPAVLQDQHAANRCPVSKALPSSARPGPRPGQVVDID